MSQQQVLFEDGFQNMPTGMFSLDAGPLTEYHFLAEAAPRYGWSVASFYFDGSKQAWHIEQSAGKQVMSQTFRNDKVFTHPMLAAGDTRWGDYELEAEVEPLEPGARCGVVVRYETNRRYYFFGFDARGLVLLRVCEETAFHQPDERVLARLDVPWKASAIYRFRVRVEGSHISCQVDGVGALTAQDDTFPKGKVGLCADAPARYHALRVTAADSAAAAFHARADRDAVELARLRAQNVQPVVWKKIPTPGFGVGRNLRFGDVNGDGKIEIIVPQVIQHGPKDAYAEVGCITALDLDGQILWRDGQPDPQNWFLTNDVAIQVHDIDGDGRLEVIYCRDFEIRILDGATGQLKKKASTPFNRVEDARFPRILGDCLCFCDVRGLGRAGDLIIKDRYWNFWVYDQDLNPLWDAACRTGHYPWVGDVDGDGRDEIAMGYALFDHDGRLLWNREDMIDDHADGIAILNFNLPDPGPLRVHYAASDDGALFLDLQGRILRHHHTGHTQNPAVLKLRADLPGLQTVTINFWGNQGILHFFDAQGDLYHTSEPVNMGSMCLPVNWRGDGVEFFLLSTNSTWGGMCDGWGRPVVAFPDDGHPDFCNAVLDLTGDCRDEIVTWNPQEIWIYTQADSPKAGRLYRPLRTPLYNSSNYQASISLPGWQEILLHDTPRY